MTQMGQKHNFTHPSWLVLIAAVGIIIWSVIKNVTYNTQENWIKLMGQTIVLSGRVVEDPDTSENKTTLRLGQLELQMEDGEMQAVDGVIFTSLRANKEIRRSDRLTVRGKLAKGFGTFSATMYRPSVLKIEQPEPGDMFLMARDHLAEKIRTVIPEPESALGLGYLLGVRSSLPEGLSETLKIVGLTHIIVASGANLSILISFARKAFAKISRFFGLIISLSLTLFYIGMVGLSPSMVRAGLVAILSLVTWYVGRKFQPSRLLIIVAALTLLYNPTYLLDLGWLLSFGSFTGILVLGPRLTRFFYGEKKPKILGATLLETVSATLLCTPILLYFFGTTSLISLLANLLILPTIAPAMALTFAAGMLTILGVPILTLVVGKIATLLLSFHLVVINFLGKQEIFLIEIPPEQPVVFLLYLPIILIPMLIAIKNYIKISKGNRRHQDGALEIVNAGEDILRQVVQRSEIADSISYQDGEKCSDKSSLNNAKQTKEPTTSRLEIEY